MKAEVAFTFYDAIAMEHQRYGTESAFGDVIEQLLQHKGNTANPSWEYVGSELSDLTTSLRKIVYFEYLDQELNNFLDSEVGSFLGNRMAEKITSAIADTSDNYTLFVNTIQNLRIKHSQSLEKIRSFTSAFRELGLEQYTLPEYPVQICLVYFPENTLSDISIIKKNIGEIEELFSLITRAINDLEGPVRLSALSTSRLKAYIHLGGVLAAAFSATVAFSLDSYKSYLEIKIQMASLASINVELEELSAHDEIRSKIASACASKLVQEFSAIGITADEMLMKASCRQAISMIDTGFDFSISDVAKPQGDMDAIDSLEAFTIENARRLTHLTLELAAIRKPHLMIENTSESE